MTAIANNDIELYVSRLVNDFEFYMRELWQDRNLDRVAPLSPIEIDIADYAANGPFLRGVLAPRGTGKTHIVAALTTWVLLRDINAKVLIVSKSATEAGKTLSLIRRWIGSVWFLKHLTPNDKSRDAAVQFDVGGCRADRTASVTVRGIDGQLEGGRAHLIIADDVETTANTLTLDARSKLDERVKEFRDILYPGLDDTARAHGVVYIGTYHHEESLYLKLADRGYAFRTWPLVYPTPDERALMLNLSPVVADALDNGTAKPGQPTMPLRFDDGEVASRRAEGRTRFAMQHMLIARLGDDLAYPLKLQDLIVMGLNRDKAPLQVVWGTHDSIGSTFMQDIPSLGFGNDAFRRPAMIGTEYADYQDVRMRIDPAGKGADKVGYAVAGTLAGYHYVLAAGGLHGGADPANITRLAEIARDFRVRTVTIESNFGGDSFGRLVQVEIARLAIKPNERPDYPNGWNAAVEAKHSVGQKELRILGALEPVMANHRLVWDVAVARNTDLQRQLTRITRQRNSLDHDDELESVAMVVADLAEELRIDPAKAADLIRRQKFDRELEAHYASLGIKRRRDWWAA